MREPIPRPPKPPRVGDVTSTTAPFGTWASPISAEGGPQVLVRKGPHGEFEDLLPALSDELGDVPLVGG